MTRCHKTRYANRREAQSAMRAILKRGRRHSKPDPKSLRIYQCPKCGGWHMTHKDEWP